MDGAGACRSRFRRRAERAAAACDDPALSFPCSPPHPRAFLPRFSFPTPFPLPPFPPSPHPLPASQSQLTPPGPPAAPQQKRHRQTQHPRKLRPGDSRDRRAGRRRHHPRDGPGRHRQPRQQTPRAGYGQRQEHRSERARAAECVGVWQDEVGGEDEAGVVRWGWVGGKLVGGGVVGGWWCWSEFAKGESAPA